MWESKITFVRLWIGITLVLLWGSMLTFFLCRDRNWLGFCVVVTKSLVLVCGSKFTWFFCGGIEIDLVLEWGSNDLGSGVEMNLIFGLGIESQLVFVFGSKMTCLSDGDWNRHYAGRHYFILSVTVDLFGICAGGGGRNWLGFWMRAANRFAFFFFNVSIKIDLVFVWMVDTDLISVSGIQLDLISV